MGRHVMSGAARRQGGRSAGASGRAVPPVQSLLERLESRLLLSANLTTYHYDNQRTGAVLNETALTPANVNINTFGKLGSYAVDGQVYAEPLYLSNLAIPNKGTHNVLFVETEHDSAYALDADTGAVLWQDSFINPAAGITTVPSADLGTQDINPEVGITGTPVIDASTNTIYMVTKTKEVSGGTTSYVDRLHALDVTTGAEKFGGPKSITATVPGTGVGSGGGSLAFQGQWENQRGGLLLTGGVLYMAFGSHGDNGPYHGWLLGYDPSTLALKYAYVPTANGDRGGIWMAGGGPSVDATGDIYVVTGNGTFDATTGGADYGDSALRLPSNLSAPKDYFRPYNEDPALDNDFGSGSLVLLPDQPGAHPHEAVTAGKTGTLYLIDRDNMGKFHSTTDAVIEAIPNVGRGFMTPTYFNGRVYYAGQGGHVLAFDLNNGFLTATPSSQSLFTYNYPPTQVAVTGNGGGNGLVWTLDDGGFAVGSPAILRVYDANNLGNELYDSGMAGVRDTGGAAVKFTLPAVVNGKVFVGGKGVVTVYGLLPPPTSPPPAPATFLASAVSTSQVNLAWSDVAGEQGFKIERSTDGVNFAQIARPNSGILNYPDVPLAANTKYYYRMRATNAAGDSPYTAVQTAVTNVTSGTVYASDLPYTAVANGWGPVEKDMSNGEQSAGDGHTITLNGTTYAKGFGTHAGSEVDLTPGGNYARFTSDVGVDDEVGNAGTVVFQVWGDGTKLFDSGTMTGASATQHVDVSVAGVQKVQLIVGDAGDGNAYDHADWAGASFTPLPLPVPPAPAGLSVVAISSGQVNVSWNDSAGETGFKLQRSTDGVNYSPLVTLGAGVLNYQDLSVAGGQIYYYKVSAGNATGYSPYSSAQNATTPVALPATPSNGRAVAVSPTQVNLTWQDNANNEDGFHVYRKAGAEATFSLVATLPPNAQAYSDMAVSPATSYDYHVQAFNAAGYADFAGASVTTPPAATGAAYVSDLAYVAVSNGWGPVEKDTSNGEQAAGDGRTITLNGVTYVKGLGVHATSEVDVALGGGYTTFATDVGVDDEVGVNGNVDFQVIADGVTLFDSGPMTGASATQHVNVNVTGKSLLKLIVNPVGTSNAYDHSDWAGAQLTSGTSVVAPTTPTGLAAAAVSTSQVDVSWNSVTGATGFVLQRSQGGGAWATVATPGAGVLGYADTGLLSGTTYSYQIAATNSGGTSAFSTPAVPATTLAASTAYVSDLPFTAVSNGWGPVEKDTSNGEQAAGDGHTITLNGVTYAKGLGVHATSEVDVNLAGNYSQFLSDVGVDDEVGNNGSVVFQVIADGVTLFNSGTMTGATATKSLLVDVTGRQKLQLIVTDNGDGNAYDHADWAGARLLPATAVHPPATPAALAAAATGNTSVKLTWADATGEAGFKVERSTNGATGFAQVGTTGSGVLTYTDGGLSPGTTYYYRVRATNSGGDSGYSNVANATTTHTQTVVASYNSGGGATGAFSADAGFTGGTTYGNSNAVDTTNAGGAPQAVFQSERYGNFSYNFTGLTPGAGYQVNLFFAEVYWVAAGQRVFNVAANGTALLTNFDIFAAAGGMNKGIEKSFSVLADVNGKISLVFSTVLDNAKVNGVQLIAL